MGIQMIYQFFLLTREGKQLLEWSKEGFPEAKQIKKREIVDKEILKELLRKRAPPEGVSTIEAVTFESLAVTYLYDAGVAYIILSDKEDPYEARKKVLKDTDKKLKPALEAIKGGREPGNFEEIFERIIEKHTRRLSGVRSGAGGSTLLGLISGAMTLFVLFLGKHVPPNPRNDTPFVWFFTTQFPPLLEGLGLSDSVNLALFIFFIAVAVLVGVITGIFAGTGVGGAVGAFLAFLVMLTPQVIEYYPIEPILEVPQTKLAKIGLKKELHALLSLGAIFGAFSALIGGSVGRVFNNRSLVSDQIPSKPQKKKKPRRKEEEEIEELEPEEALERLENEEFEVDVENEHLTADELEELKDAFGEEEEE